MEASEWIGDEDGCKQDAGRLVADANKAKDDTVERTGNSHAWIHRTGGWLGDEWIARE